MMMVAAWTLLMPQSNPPTVSSLLKACLAVHSKPAVLSAQVSITATTKGKPSRQETYKVAARLPGSARVSYGTRSITMIGQQGVAIDTSLVEYIRKTYTDQRLQDRLTLLAGTLSEPVAFVLDPRVSRSFIDRVLSAESTTRPKSGGPSKVTGSIYKLSVAGSNYVLKQSSKVSQSEVWIDRTSKRLTRYYEKSVTNSIDMRFKYSAAPASISFPALNGREVAEFSNGIAARYKDSSSKKVASRAWNRYSTLKSAAYQAKSGSTATQVAVSGTKAMLKSGAWKWAYDGTTLVAINSYAKGYWRAKCAPGNVLYYLSTCHAPVETLLRNRLGGNNMIGPFFGSDKVIEYRAGYGSGNANFDVILTSKPAVKVEIEVRRETGLVSRIQSSVSLNGSRGSETTTFSYQSVNGNLPISTFQIKIPAGYSKRVF